MDGDYIGRVDSEIAFTALLSGIVSSYSVPANGFYPYVKFSAISLLFLTLARRMAIIQGIKTDSKILRITTYLMDLATYVSSLYILYIMAAGIASTTRITGSDTLLFGITTPVFVFSIFLAWETTYRSALKEGERIFGVAGQRHQGEFLGVVSAEISNFVRKRRCLDKSSTKQVSLTHFNDTDESLDEIDIERQFHFAFSVIVLLFSIALLILIYAALIWLTGFLFGGWWVTRFLLLISTLSVSAFVRMWYSKYGIVQVEDRNGYVTVLCQCFTYFVMCAILL